MSNDKLIAPKVSHLVDPEQLRWAMEDTSMTDEAIAMLEDARLAQEEEKAQRVTEKFAGARLRAQRGNMLRRLDKKFNNYEEFTPEWAGQQIGVKTDIVEGYLRSESRTDGSRIRAGSSPNTYMLISPFD